MILVTGWAPLFAVCVVGWMTAPGPGVGFATQWLVGALLLFPVMPLFINRRAAASIKATAPACPAFHQNEVGQMEVGVSSSRLVVGDVRVQVYDAHTHCDLLDKKVERVSVPLSNHARGVFDFPPVMLSTRFPFGLFRARVSSHPSGQYVVYPAVEVGAPAWPQPKTKTSPTATSRSGEEVVAFRDYLPGDALGTVDWKVSARTQSLVVRQFEHNKPQDLKFSFDQVEHLGLEKGLSRLTAWIVRAHAQGIHYGLSLGGQDLAPDHSPSHRHACLSALAMFRQEVVPDE